MESNFRRNEEIDRIMSPNEARAKCAEMKLDDRVTQFVVIQFEEKNSEDGHDWCGCRRGRHEPGECEKIQTGEADGRIAWGQSWEGVAEELAEAFDVDPEKYMDDPTSYTDVDRVWNAFFCE